MNNPLDMMFSIGRTITKDSTNSYVHLAFALHLQHYKLISYPELIVKGRYIRVPEYVKVFIQKHSEVIMVANIINNRVVGLTFRTIGKVKDFSTWGNNKGLFYGLGALSPDFKYGQPIILVEGLLDCDVIKQFYPNVMAVLTNSLTKLQVDVLKYLTNNVIMLLDNDNAGIQGTKESMKSLGKSLIVRTLSHYPSLKDAGDLVKCEINKDPNYNFIYQYYKTMIEGAVLS